MSISSEITLQNHKHIATSKKTFLSSSFIHFKRKGMKENLSFKLISAFYSFLTRKLMDGWMLILKKTLFDVVLKMDFIRYTENFWQSYELKWCGSKWKKIFTSNFYISHQSSKSYPITNTSYVVFHLIKCHRIYFAVVSASWI